MDRFAQFSVIAGREAMQDAGFVPSREQGLRSAIIMGSGIGGLSTLDLGFQRLYVQGLNKVYPLSVPKVMLNAGVSALSMQFGILGPCFAVSSACSSANHAISQAFAMVRGGQVDLALTGGSEACLTFGMMKAWEALQVLAPDTCRPFSKGRRGIILGEGVPWFWNPSTRHWRAAPPSTRNWWAAACPRTPPTSRSRIPMAPLAPCRPPYWMRVWPRAGGLHQRPRHRHPSQ